MEFPILTQTRKGTPVELIGYDKGSDRPWYGFIVVDLEDVKYKNPMSWMKGGHYFSETVERSLDITVPI